MSSLPVTARPGRWRIIVPMLTVLLAAACTTPARNPGSSRDIGSRLLVQYVRPGAAKLVTSTHAMQSALERYCAKPADASRRGRVEQQFATLARDWAAVEVVRFGPLVEANRLEQFFFFPDPRGVVQRQVRAVLAASDGAVPDATTLGGQSVAVQGMPALEYALHADDAAEVIAADGATGRHRCTFARAVAANMARVASEVAAGWQADAPLAREFSAPAATNVIYRTDAEVATEAVKAVATTLHAMRDQKLLPGLGDDAASARPALLPLQRSSQTAAFIGAQARALERWFAASGLGASLRAGDAWIDDALRDELLRVVDDMAGVTLPVPQALVDADQRELLVHAALVLANASDIVEQHLAPALSVNLGFNSLDGD